MNIINTSVSNYSLKYPLDVIIATIKEYHIKLSFEDCAFLISYENQLKDELSTINEYINCGELDASDYSQELANIKKQDCERELVKIDEIKTLMCGGKQWNY